ncbi:MAG: DUF4136 domain-containing protein [Chitinophagaceae bacterium]|jgi:hypothetical protein|nr:DUF4136 domain-containing protein [Sphingobacteriales bacterium]OJV97438.1 MAG: hypothetical protein BGO52_09105 [Sphingobacteriales bacterium 44-61]TXJ23483.1 MAG: DUF4136 domain-containing protein [Chitinophagaceae bacterium]
MKKNWTLWSLSLGIVFLLASCAPSAHIEKDDNTDFSRYKSFAWIDRDGKSKIGSANDLAERKIRQAVNKELEKTAGWRETTRNPDVLLSYDVLVEKSVKSVNDPVYSRPFTRTFYSPYSRRFINVYYPSQFMGYDNYDVPTREGTVTISMIDADTDKTVWQGWSTAEVDSRKMTSKEIENSVKAIFRKFDVAKK